MYGNPDNWINYPFMKFLQDFIPALIFFISVQLLLPVGTEHQAQSGSQAEAKHH